MNTVLSRITNILIIVGTIALAVFVIGIDYHILWIGEWRGHYFESGDWELWKKVLIFIAEIILFIGCVMACLYLFFETLDDDIEADSENFWKGLLALICCGGLPGVMFWVCMIQDAISSSINWGSHHTYTRTTSSSDDDDEEDDSNEEESDEEDEEEYGIRYHEKRNGGKKEQEEKKTEKRVVKKTEKKVDKPDSTSTPRRVLKRRSDK